MRSLPVSVFLWVIIPSISWGQSDTLSKGDLWYQSFIKAADTLNCTYLNFLLSAEGVQFELDCEMGISAQWSRVPNNIQKVGRVLQEDQKFFLAGLTLENYLENLLNLVKQAEYQYRNGSAWDHQVDIKKLQAVMHPVLEQEGGRLLGIRPTLSTPVEYFERTSEVYRSAQQTLAQIKKNREAIERVALEVKALQQDLPLEQEWQQVNTDSLSGQLSKWRQEVIDRLAQIRQMEESLEQQANNTKSKALALALRNFRKEGTGYLGQASDSVAEIEAITATYSARLNQGWGNGMLFALVGAILGLFVLGGGAWWWKKRRKPGVAQSSPNPSPAIISTKETPKAKNKPEKPHLPVSALTSKDAEKLSPTPKDEHNAERLKHLEKVNAELRAEIIQVRNENKLLEQQIQRGKEEHTQKQVLAEKQTEERLKAEYEQSFQSLKHKNEELKANVLDLQSRLEEAQSYSTSADLPAEHLLFENKGGQSLSTATSEATNKSSPLPDEPILAPTSSDITKYYFPQAHDGSFLDKQKKGERVRNTMWTVIVSGNDPKTGELSIIDEPEIRQKLLRDKGSLSRIVEAVNDETRLVEAKDFQVKEAGRVVLEGDKWKVKKKIKIQID